MPNGDTSSFAQAIVDLLGKTADSLTKLVERRWGETRAFIEDVRDNIRFEDSKIDAVRFEADITAAGVITNPAPIRIHPEYLFAADRLYGYISDPATTPNDAARVVFTIRENGRGIDVFTTPHTLASLITGSGSGLPFEFKTPYVFREAAEIQVTFAIVPGVLGAFQTARRVGVVLTGDLVRKKILP